MAHSFLESAAPCRCANSFRNSGQRSRTLSRARFLSALFGDLLRAFGDFCGISGNHIGRDRTGRARMYLDVVVRVVGGDGFEPPNPAL